MNDLQRRKKILTQHIGQTVAIRRGVLTPRHKLFGLTTATIHSVGRTRVVLDFAEGGQWTFPIGEVLLPFSVEPLPGQIELFAEVPA